MTDNDWGVLLHAINTGNCILMLGPEIATEKVDGKQESLMEILANDLAKQRKVKSEIIDCNNLAHVAQKYSHCISKMDLQFIAQEFFRKREFQSSEIHSYLAELPFYLVISASHDNYFIEALKKQGKDYIYKWYNFRGDKQDIVETGTKKTPLIYCLYGSVAESESLILSEDDLLDFLVAVISKNPPLPANISSELRNKNKCFLFIGFGFKNWYLRILLHVLQEKSNRESRSFALERIKLRGDPNFQYALIFLKDQYKIHYYDMELKNFVKELNKRYLKLSRSLPKKLMAIEAPAIFICHCNEDKKFAMKLYNYLKRAGLNPWLDKEDIEAGSEWERETLTRIKESDYFLILQSKTLIGKKKGFVNREINLALDCQLEFRNLSFIIPAKIDDCDLLDELIKWQTIDLSQQSGFENLIQTIKRDQERRKKR